VFLFVGFAECGRWDCAMGRVLSARNARNSGRLRIYDHVGWEKLKDEETNIDHIALGDILHPVLKIHVHLDEIPVRTDRSRFGYAASLFGKEPTIVSWQEIQSRDGINIQAAR
jgi:hypothetical protein